MSRIVTFLTLLSHLQFATSNFRTCVPNTQFFLNDRICYCDGKGQWTEASCVYGSQRQICQPGQVVWHGCSQCVCQETGQLLCNMVTCSEDIKSVTTAKGINSIGPWCTPFRIYYVDCHICVCPESGRTSNVHCVKDNSCTALRTPSIADLLTSTNKNSCKPKVLYLFSCLQCLCSDEGFFVLNNCVQTCQSTSKTNLSLTCTPHSFYRNDCNVCLCPSDGIHSDASCTQEICDGKYRFKVLQALTSEIKSCTPYQFTPRQCLYCHCNPEGTINQQACLELNCLKSHSNEYIILRSTCSPGEMLPFCTECFCLSNGTTHSEYCTRGCSYHSKIEALEKVFNDSRNNSQLINWNALDTTSNGLNCRQNSIYAENDKFCLCPDSQTKEKSCLVAVKKAFNFLNPASQFDFRETTNNIDFNRTCQPSTFVEFDCNTCFCSKNGTIDPKWCTYDDCDAKRMVVDSQKAQNLVTRNRLNSKCIPGSITELQCNFCICPDSGQIIDRACTKNPCSDVPPVSVRENFDCDPLEYYEVDCNICLCPRDGKKNVAKCTKNVCEDNFLRSGACVPGRLFSEECNICVCPPDGNKKDRVCTKHDCKTSETAWKRIFKFSNGIIEELSGDDVPAKKIDLCFPGEEFTIGFHFCVCPEMGLRSYATCTVLVGDELNNDRNDRGDYIDNMTLGVGDSFAGRRKLAINECFVYNISTVPTSTYLKGCQQCLSPSTDDVDEYCRPLNRSQCDASGIGESVTSNSTGSKTIAKIALAAHTHTHYKCAAQGKVKDRCHECECEQDDSMVREHCFSSNDDSCAGAFLLGHVLPLHAQYLGKKAKTLHWESCNSGDTIENKCNKCVCVREGVYECEPTDCQLTDRDVQFYSEAECHPNRLYFQGSTTCICSPKGQWPHSSCRELFKQLPKDSIKKRTCDPQGYVKVDCNVCRCNDKGEVDKTRCTTNQCKKHKPKTRKSDGDDTSNLFGTCEVKNWYSMAPCQFCYCLESHKLICSTGINKQTNMPLGRYHLVLCGPGLLKEVAALVPGIGKKRSALRSSDPPIENKYWHQDFQLSQPSQPEDPPETQDQGNMQEEDSSENPKTLVDVKRFRDDYDENNSKQNEIRINLAANLDATEALTEEPSKSVNFNPMDVINKIIQFRRSLTLDPRAKCVPGTMTSVKCNICHCLKNGKLLCTNKKCK